MVSRRLHAATHFKGRLTIDVLHMGKSKFAADAFLQNAENRIGGFLYFAPSSARERPSQKNTGVASSSAIVKLTLDMIRQ